MADNIRRLSPDERLGQNRSADYLGSEDVDPGTEPILTIEGIYHGKVTLQRGKEEKDVIKFIEKTVPGIKVVRPLIVNATNRKILRKLFGGVQQKNLEGRRIQIYVDHNVRDPQDGGLTDGLRIRPYLPKEKEYICFDCKKVIAAAHGMTAERVAEHTQKSYGRPLCAECGAIEKAKREAAKIEGDVLNNENDETQN